VDLVLEVHNPAVNLFWHVYVSDGDCHVLGGVPKPVAFIGYNTSSGTASHW
jgi:hypothetical protein